MTEVLDERAEAIGSPPPRKRKIAWFNAQDAVSLAESGIMSPADISPEVLAQVDITPILAGARTRVLFQDPSPTGFSLVHAWFGENFPLPRHSHSADCLYYILAGEVHMGTKVIRAGEGLFVPAGRPYTYRAGNGGVELLEFRSSTSFDIKILDKDVAKWKSFVAIAETMRDTWLTTRPPG